MHRLFSLAFLIQFSLSVFLFCAGHADAQGTAFSFQGRLNVNNASPTGLFDFRFTLFDAATNGSIFGGTLTVDDLQVTNGLFVAKLDFGAQFNGQNRWIEIEVRDGASGGSYTLLSPRLQTLPTPYAIYSGNADMLDGLDSTAFSLTNHTHSFSQLTSPPLTLVANLPTSGVVSAVNTNPSGVGVRGLHFAGAGTASGVLGETNSIDASAVALLGRVNSTTPGGFSSAVRGLNNGTGGLGIGVYGSQGGSGWGVYGTTPSGIGVHGNSANGFGVFGLSTGGTGIYGNSTNGIAGQVEISNSANTNSAFVISNPGQGSSLLIGQTNAANPSPALLLTNAGTSSGVTLQMTNAASGESGLLVKHSGFGRGVFAVSAGGTGLEGITGSISAAGVIGRNTNGEAVVGINKGGNGVGAVVGRNDNAGYGVRGFNTSSGIGVLGQAGISGGTGVAGRFENVNAANGSDVAVITGNGTGYTLRITAAGTAGRGLIVNTAAGQGRAAITINNGTLVLTPQNGYTTGGVVDNPIIRISAAGVYNVPVAGVPNGTTVWFINDTGGAVTISNVVGGAFGIAVNRAKQFIFYSSVDVNNWIATQ